MSFPLFFFIGLSNLPQWFARVNCPEIYCFQSKRTINHLAHRDSLKWITAAVSTGLSADPQTALHTVRSKHKKTTTGLCCALISACDLPFYFPHLSFLFFLFLDCPFLPLTLFPSLWWCSVSLSNKHLVSNAPIDFFYNKDGIKVIHQPCNWIVFTEC